MKASCLCVFFLFIRPKQQTVQVGILSCVVEMTYCSIEEAWGDLGSSSQQPDNHPATQALSPHYTKTQSFSGTNKRNSKKENTNEDTPKKRKSKSKSKRVSGGGSGGSGGLRKSRKSESVVETFANPDGTAAQNDSPHASAPMDYNFSPMGDVFTRQEAPGRIPDAVDVMLDEGAPFAVDYSSDSDNDQKSPSRTGTMYRSGDEGGTLYNNQPFDQSPSQFRYLRSGAPVSGPSTLTSDETAQDNQDNQDNQDSNCGAPPAYTLNHIRSSTALRHPTDTGAQHVLSSTWNKKRGGGVGGAEAGTGNGDGALFVQEQESARAFTRRNMGPPSSPVSSSSQIHGELEWMRNNMSHLCDRIDRLADGIDNQTDQAVQTKRRNEWLDMALFVIIGIMTLALLDIAFRAGQQSPFSSLPFQ